jgi:hypothetical protein
MVKRVYSRGKLLYLKNNTWKRRTRLTTGQVNKYTRSNQVPVEPTIHGQELLGKQLLPDRGTCGQIQNTLFTTLFLYYRAKPLFRRGSFFQYNPADSGNFRFDGINGAIPVDADVLHPHEEGKENLVQYALCFF